MVIQDIHRQILLTMYIRFSLYVVVILQLKHSERSQAKCIELVIGCYYYYYYRLIAFLPLK